MARVFTEDQLAELGYVETSPGIFVNKSGKSLDRTNKKITQRSPSSARYAGHYVVGDKKYYFRSGWEYIYACYLQFLLETNNIASWEYEPHTFWFDKIKRGARSYLPDFKVTENDGAYHWVEVKGHMDRKSATKLKRMAKYYPDEKILLVQNQEIKQIKKQLGIRLGE